MDVLHKLPTGEADYNKKNNCKEEDFRHERSKREDIENLGHDFITVGCTDHRYCTKCGEEDHVIKSKMMRCSEHG